MFATATPLLQSSDVTAALGTITGQIAADLPALIGLLAGLTAIGFVIGLARKFMRPKAH